MINPAQIKQMADEWLEKMPGQGFNQEMKMMLKAHFQQWLVQANLVTREEFDVQAELLERTQQRLSDLEGQIEQLSQQIEKD